MSQSLPAELLNALPTPAAGASADVAINLAALQGDLELVAQEAAAAKTAGLISNRVSPEWGDEGLVE